MGPVKNNLNVNISFKFRGGPLNLRYIHIQYLSISILKWFSSRLDLARRDQMPFYFSIQYLTRKENWHISDRI